MEYIFITPEIAIYFKIGFRDISFLPFHLFFSNDLLRILKVHHTRMANGFVFINSDGRKIVFSGDTKPCDLLVEHGMNADLLIHEATFEDDHEVGGAYVPLPVEGAICLNNAFRDVFILI